MEISNNYNFIVKVNPFLVTLDHRPLDEASHVILASGLCLGPMLGVQPRESPGAGLTGEGILEAQPWGQIWHWPRLRGTDPWPALVAMI